MKCMKFLAVALFSVGLSIAATSVSAGDENNRLRAQMLAATDARDDENPVFEHAVKAGNFEALAMLGQIGGEACQTLLPYLRSENSEARRWAAKGAEFCQDDSLSPHLLAQFELELPANNGPLARALGFSGKADTRAVLARLLNKSSGAVTGATLFGLLQSVAYAPTNAADIEGLDVSALLNIAATAHKPQAVQGDGAYAAAYLLARLQNVPDLLPYDVYAPVLRKFLTSASRLEGTQLETARLMTRLAREYGTEAIPDLRAAAEVSQLVVRHEAIRSMGRLSDAASKSYLLGLANGEGEAASRHLAVAALGQRSAADTALVPVLEQFVSDDNRWVATTALRWLGQRDAVAANEIAADWLGGEGYYLAFQALIALTGSEEGKAILKTYADTHPDTVRGYEAAVALDPSIEAVTKPRKTPSMALLASYKSRELVLETTRGILCITMTGDAPYAATSFLQLADVGKMDGMLWHRVIPNFVSQAGQIENKEIARWGSIREEWGGEHRIGTVGVATAGRDTGTTQFFINTSYNMHLNGRYTVFGKVAKGMDVVYALEEGDVITKAYTVKAGNRQCE